MSRFCRKELSTAIDDMRKLLQQEKGKDIGNEGRTLASPPQQQSATNGESSTRQNGHGQKLNPYTGLVPSVTLHPSLQNMSDMVASNNGQNGILPSNSNPASSELSNSSPPYLPPNLSMTILNTPTRLIRRYTDSALTPEIFPSIWALGEPLVVTDLKSKFKINWTPEYFMEKYGNQSCLIIECQTDVNKRITVGEFFKDFGKYEGREDCWKLKVKCKFLIHALPGLCHYAGLAPIY